MQKWKRVAIILNCLNVFLLFVGLYDYYDFFIKECRDAFPFNYCPWGGESMGWAWRSADVYLTNLVSSCTTLLFFIPVSLYFLYKKNYKVSFWLALSPTIISWTDSLLGTLLYHYAKFQTIVMIKKFAFYTIFVLFLIWNLFLLYMIADTIIDICFYNCAEMGGCHWGAEAFGFIRSSAVAFFTSLILLGCLDVFFIYRSIIEVSRQKQRKAIWYAIWPSLLTVGYIFLLTV